MSKLSTDIKLIGLVGKKHSGKDTFAKMLEERYIKKGYDVKLVHFADILKQTCADILELDLNLFYDKKDEDFEKPFEDAKLLRYLHNRLGYPEGRKMGQQIFSKPRDILQYFGTDVARKYNAYIWVDLLKNKIINTPHTIARPPIYLVADVRFENEGHFIKSNSGELILIDRKELDNVNDAHASEDLSWIDKFGSYFIVKNNGTLDDLKSEADTFAKV